jgi:hypothetical protein
VREANFKRLQQRLPGNDGEFSSSCLTTSQYRIVLVFKTYVVLRKPFSDSLKEFEQIHINGAQRGAAGAGGMQVAELGLLSCIVVVVCVISVTTHPAFWKSMGVMILASS